VTATINDRNCNWPGDLSTGGLQDGDGTILQLPFLIATENYS
jgi:hypothetical protein